MNGIHAHLRTGNTVQRGRYPGANKAPAWWIDISTRLQSFCKEKIVPRPSLNIDSDGAALATSWRLSVVGVYILCADIGSNGCHTGIQTIHAASYMTPRAICKEALSRKTIFVDSKPQRFSAVRLMMPTEVCDGARSLIRHSCPR